MANRPERNILEEAKRAAGRKDWSEAARLFKELAQAEPDNPAHWHNLGIAGIRGDVAASAGPFQRALLLRPRDANYLNNLLVRETGAGREKLLRRLLVLAPDHARARTDLAFVLLRAEKHDRAVHMARSAQMLEPAMPESLGRFVQGLAGSGRTGTIRSLHRRYLTLDPGDRVGVSRDLARAGLIESDQAMSPDFVAAVFDGYAATFDDHLTGTLRYIGHEILARMLGGLTVRKARRVVDLGCGSGLSGMELRRFADHLTGIDLSEKMLERARARGVYDALHRAEIVSWLEADGGGYGIAMAADVTSYLGDLAPFFRAVAAKLVPAGVLAMTVHEQQAGEFGIVAGETYSHSLGHVERAARAAGLAISALERGAMRHENKQPLPTLFLVLTRA